MTRDAVEPHLWVGDLAASRAFYERALGFEVVQQHPPDAPAWSSGDLDGPRQAPQQDDA